MRITLTEGQLMQNYGTKNVKNFCPGNFIPLRARYFDFGIYSVEVHLVNFRMKTARHLPDWNQISFTNLRVSTYGWSRSESNFAPNFSPDSFIMN